MKHFFYLLHFSYFQLLFFEYWEYSSDQDCQAAFLSRGLLPFLPLWSVGELFSAARSVVKHHSIASPELCDEVCVNMVCREKVTVPKTKSRITFQGVSASKTVIQYGDTAESAGSTSKSASVAVLSDYFIALNITFSVLVKIPRLCNSFTVSFGA